MMKLSNNLTQRSNIQKRTLRDMICDNNWSKVSEFIHQSDTKLLYVGNKHRPDSCSIYF